MNQIFEELPGFSYKYGRKTRYVNTFSRPLQGMNSLSRTNGSKITNYSLRFISP